MPREFSRKVRVAEGIKRVLGTQVSDWMREHGTGMASVTEATVSRDLKRTQVHISLYGCPDPKESLAQLRAESWRFRNALGRELRLRHTPEIEFCLDETIEHGDKLSRLLDDLNANDSHE